MTLRWNINESEMPDIRIDGLRYWECGRRPDLGGEIIDQLVLDEG